MSLTGALRLAGTAESVWIFQASSTLTIGSGAIITMSGGATVCNVFWQVGSSATLNPGAQFVGTVMAQTSITAETGATVDGRLLARTGAVTLDDNVITSSPSCDTSPDITSSAPPAGQAGEEYDFTVTASGSPTPTFSITSGSLPAGLSLDGTTGEITGTPTTPGSFTFTVTASNGATPDASETYSLTIAAASAAEPTAGDGPEDELARSGIDVGPALLVGLGAITLGVVIRGIRRRPSSAPRHRASAR